MKLKQYEIRFVLHLNLHGEITANVLSLHKLSVNINAILTRRKIFKRQIQACVRLKQQKGLRQLG
jgi:hypothetical protein